MLAALNIFLFALLAFGNSSQYLLLCDEYSGKYISENTYQISDKISFKADYHSDQTKRIDLAEESFSWDDSDSLLDFRFVLPGNHRNLFYRVLRILKNFQYNCIHISFLELDLPPPDCIIF